MRLQRNSSVYAREMMTLRNSVYFIKGGKCFKKVDGIMYAVSERECEFGRLEGAHLLDLGMVACALNRYGVPITEKRKKAFKILLNQRSNFHAKSFRENRSVDATAERQLKAIANERGIVSKKIVTNSIIKKMVRRFKGLNAVAMEASVPEYSREKRRLVQTCCWYFKSLVEKCSSSTLFMELADRVGRCNAMEIICYDPKKRGFAMIWCKPFTSIVAIEPPCKVKTIDVPGGTLIDRRNMIRVPKGGAECTIVETGRSTRFHLKRKGIREQVLIRMSAMSLCEEN